MTQSKHKRHYRSATLCGAVLFGIMLSVPVHAEEPLRGQTSYSPVDIKEDFAKTMARMKAEKPSVMARQKALLSARYDLSDRPAKGVTMSGGKPIQEGVRVKLPAGMTWDKLAAMSPEEVREKYLFPKGLFPLPFPNHPEGGMLFPQFHIDSIL